MQENVIETNSTKMGVLEVYDAAISKNPILAQMVMALVVTAIGDILAQQFFEKPKLKSTQPTAYSIKRTIKFALIGAVYAAPILAFWLIFLDDYFGPDFSFSKLFADQIFMNPIITGGFIWINGVSNGVSLKDSLKLIKNDFPNLMLKAWPYWTVISAVNFTLVPLNYRLLVIKLASIAWNTFLSLFAKKANDRVLLIEEQP